MSKLVGKKSKIEPGYVWAPYIISYDTTLTSSFAPAKMISSRYKNPKVEKIKKILEKIEDSNFTSS